MVQSPHVVDCTTADFPEAVLATSRRLPVVVDFWAPWCGPCRTLMPLLTRLAGEYGGQFLLAKVNIDEQPELASRFGVRSVPTVKLFRDGAPVDEFMGALPESAIRQFLDRHVPKVSDLAIDAALQAAERGDMAGAERQLDELLRSEPENVKGLLALARLQFEERHYTAAAATLERLPPSARDEAPVQQLAAALHFAGVAADAPPSPALEQRIAANPRDSEARYQLAGRLMMEGSHAAGMDQLLEILRRDRKYGDDAGRTGLLLAFQLLGDHELVARYRGLMFNALH
jgi:putative thioredoxin